MSRLIVFMALLAMTLAKKELASLCTNGNNGIPSAQLNLLKSLDKLVKEVSDLIPEPEHQQMLHKVKESMKSNICASKLKQETVSSIAKFLDGVQNKLEVGLLTKSDIMGFLEKNQNKSMWQMFNFNGDKQGRKDKKKY